MKIEKAREYLEKLKQYWEIEKCTHCECLLGALIQLKLDWPELKEEMDKLISDKMHECLGCETCPPAEAWEEYLKEREEKKR